MNRRVIRPLFWSAVPLALVAGAAYSRLGVLPGSGHPTDVGQVDPRVVVLNSPHLRDYEHVPLPVGEPPEGAQVRSTSYADSVASGEHIAFEFPEFTVAACTVGKQADPDACAPQIGVQVFRTVTVGDRVTTFSIVSKLTGGTTSSRAQEALTFFTDAQLAPRPGWMKTYVLAELKERYGYGR